MLALNKLSSNQKSQIRNAFTLIDGESRDSKITKQDLVNLYKTLNEQVPSDKQLDAMLSVEGELGAGKTGKEKQGMSFTQFLLVMAKELNKMEDRTTLSKALEHFTIETQEDEMLVDVEKLKEACCSVQLGDIGSGDHRLSRKTFNSLIEGFVKEQLDGKKVFQASKWLDAYID